MYSMKCVRWAVLVLALIGRGLARAPRPACPPDAKKCVVVDEEQINPSFFINGVQFEYEFTDGEFFAFTCPQGITLDDPSLPRFEPALQVREVRLACPPPAASYEAALSALNVTAPASSQDATEDHPTYSITLKLDAIGNFDARLLAATPELRNLSITNTELNASDLALLPIGLEYLSLNRTKISRVPADVFTRLQALHSLTVIDQKPVILESVGNLSSLSITSSSTLMNVTTLPDSLQSLHLFGWKMDHPEPWRSCAGLTTLRLYTITARTLPNFWLARCGQLRALYVIRSSNLRTLPAGLLRGATALLSVEILDCSLETLPEGLFNDSRALRDLNLDRNYLHTLPSDLFRPTHSLSTLSLIKNKLDESVLDVLRTATSLNVLRLDDNPALDACPDTRDHEHTSMHGSSALGNLKNLTELSLSGTATTRVCPDWRQLPRLQKIDLYNTNTTRFTFTDLWFNNTARISVGLDSMILSLRREDYYIIAAAPVTSSVTLDIKKPVHCDCELTWTAAALCRNDTFLNEQGATCEDGRILSNVPLDEFECPAPPGSCPTDCSCTVYEDIALPGRVLKLNCAGRKLRSLPPVDTGPDSFAVDLRVSSNRINRLSRDNLPRRLLRLDLRDNSLGLIDDEAVSALVSRADRRVLLANNPLECGCRAAAALATMRDHPNIFPDWANATCSNGTALSLAMPLPCDNDKVTTSMSDESGMSGSAVAALVLGVVAVAALVLVLGWLSLRRRHHLSVLPSQLPPATYTGEWLYDAFVSFTHADEAIVLELVERLEGGAEPFRLCVHYRDWMPGDWIPEQIAASVRVSRRTVAVVSEAYLRSKWARAEIREAYAAAVESAEPRLILVFLEDPSRLPLDADLSNYVAGNTYVCWGDPWFWQKLRRALPDPLPRQADESQASPGPSGPMPASPFMDSRIELAGIETSPE